MVRKTLKKMIPLLRGCFRRLLDTVAQQAVQIKEKIIGEIKDIFFCSAGRLEA